MSKTTDALERENAELKERLARQEYRFDPQRKLQEAIEGDHARLEQRRRERRNQEGGGGDE